MCTTARQAWISLTACGNVALHTFLQVLEDRNRYPVGYWSRQLNEEQKNYSVTEKECLAIVWAIKELRPYLERERLAINVDHHSLRWLLNLTDASGRLAWWRLRLSEFDFTVLCLKGLKNSLADAMSCLPTTGGTTAPVDEDILCFVLSCEDEDNPADADLECDVFDELIAASCLNVEERPIVSAVSADEMMREQSSDPFC